MRLSLKDDKASQSDAARSTTTCTDLTRRRIVTGGVAACGASFFTMGCTPAANVSPVDDTLLPSIDEIWNWQFQLNVLGPRYTGNEAHTMFVEFLSKHLAAAGLEVRRDTYHFNRWEAQNVNLALVGADADHLPVPVASAYPYSGLTGPNGVEGPLIYGGKVPDFVLPADIDGKIVFIDSPTPNIDLSVFFELGPENIAGAAFPPLTTSPAVQQLSAPDLTPFARAGAKGVILGWSGYNEQEIADQYIPFSRPLQGVPGVWVGESASDKLREASKAGARASLTLDGDIHANTRTDTLYALAHGATNEIIIINSHTDGPNAVEENGGLALIALARYLAAAPHGLRRSILFVLTSGHFARPYVPSIQGFIDAHPDMLSRCVAAVTIEHLGAMAAAGGKPETGLSISTRPALRQALFESAQSVSLDDFVTAHPIDVELFFGEARQLHKSGTPAIGYIPLPGYLLSGPSHGHIDKVDKNRLYKEIRMFARMLHAIDALPTSELRRKQL